MSESLIELYKKALGSKTTEKASISQELKYLIIVELLHNNRQYSGSNIKPINSIKEAAVLAIQNLKEKVSFTVQEKDFITFTGVEFLYSDVPVQRVLKDYSSDFQCIESRWLTNEELKELLGEKLV